MHCLKFSWHYIHIRSNTQILLLLLLLSVQQKPAVDFNFHHYRIPRYTVQQHYTYNYHKTNWGAVSNGLIVVTWLWAGWFGVQPPSRNKKLITHLHLVLRLGLNRALPLLPLHVQHGAQSKNFTEHTARASFWSGSQFFKMLDCYTNH